MRTFRIIVAPITEKISLCCSFDRHIDTLFRITHSATFNVAIQALVLLWHVASSRPVSKTLRYVTLQLILGSFLKSILDRFYRAVYESLLDPRLAFASKKAMYLNLLFKALKADDNHARVAAFVKRFLQALGMHEPGFICGALFLLGEVRAAAILPPVVMNNQRFLLIISFLVSIPSFVHLQPNLPGRRQHPQQLRPMNPKQTTRY